MKIKKWCCTPCELGDFHKDLYVRIIVAIRLKHPTLTLADIYSAIAFYLNHQPEVETYLQQREQQAQEIRRINKAKFDPQGLRDRLIARKTQQQVC